MTLINDVAYILTGFFVVDITFRVHPCVCIGWDTSGALQFVQRVAQFPPCKPRLVFQTRIGSPRWLSPCRNIAAGTVVTGAAFAGDRAPDAFRAVRDSVDGFAGLSIHRIVEIRKASGEGLGAIQWTIHPGAIPKHDTLAISARVLNTVKPPNHAAGVDLGLYRDPAPRCVRR
jgi:hypothetical protein